MSSSERPQGLPVLALAAAVIAFDAAGIGHTMPGLSAATGADARQAAWFVTAYVLGALAGAPVIARIAGAWHRGRTLGCALLLFAAGAWIVASADGFALAVAGRFVQGVGGSAVMPLAGAHIAERWPTTRRGGALASLSVAYGLGFLGGVVLTSLVLLWSHRVAFVLWGGLAAGIAAIVATTLPRGEAGPAGSGPRLDALGIATWIGALAAFAIGLNRLALPGGAAWSPFALGGAVFAAFLWTQARSAAPLLPVALLRARAGRIGALLALVAGEGQVFTVQLPSLAVHGLGVSPAASGPLMAPLVVGGLGASVWMTRTLDRIGPRRALLAGVTALGAGAALAALSATAVVGFAAATAAIGFGVGVVSGAPLRSLAADVASAADRDAAQAAVGMLTNVGLLLGGSLFGACAGAAADPLVGLRTAIALGVAAAAPLALSALFLPPSRPGERSDDASAPRVDVP